MRGMFIVGLCLTLTAPAFAQTREQDEQEQPSPLPVQIGRTAASSVGEAGQRQTGQASVNVAPMGRVGTRIENRIQSRIANRIDRNYDALPGTTSSFTAAADQVRIAGAGR